MYVGKQLPLRLLRCNSVNGVLPLAGAVFVGDVKVVRWCFVLVGFFPRFSGPRWGLHSAYHVRCPSGHPRRPAGVPYILRALACAFPRFMVSHASVHGLSYACVAPMVVPA